MSWKKVSSKQIYRNKWFSVREDQVIRPDGNAGTYAVVNTEGPGVFIVAVNDQQELVLVKMFRYPTQMVSWEVPGGNAENLPSLQAAKKELWEETGLKAKTWHKVGTFQAWNGIASEMEYTYLAQDLTMSKENEQKEEGITDMQTVSFAQAFAMIKSGKITDDQSITAILQAALFLNIITL